MVHGKDWYVSFSCDELDELVDASGAMHAEQLG